MHLPASFRERVAVLTLSSHERAALAHDIILPQLCRLGRPFSQALPVLALLVPLIPSKSLCAMLPSSDALCRNCKQALFVHSHPLPRNPCPTCQSIRPTNNYLAQDTSFPQFFTPLGPWPPR